jgi:hypothetical protein
MPGRLYFQVAGTAGMQAASSITPCNAPVCACLQVADAALLPANACLPRRSPVCWAPA